MITLLLNPAAGNGRSKKVANAAAAYLKKKDLPYQILETHGPLDATNLCKKLKEDAKEGDLLLVIGGDGTFSEVVDGLAGSSLPVAILGAGTGNDMLKSFPNVPKKPEEALPYILAQAPHKMDLCRLNGIRFANESGLGFDVAVLDHTEKAKKYFKGLLPYLWGVIKTIFTYKSIPLRITADGKTILEEECLVLSVANGQYIGGGIRISPTANPEDGLMDVIVMRCCSKARMVFSYLPGLLQGKILSFPHAYHCRAKEVTVEPLRKDETLRVNVDGEILDQQSCSYKIEPESLWIQM
ncbi:MAG: diacylglycerol kinase family lipid kinase [Clostridia bacterium]|nr:diacylglycerol kinase family lipid kinase [Clostridia bacterium]